MELIRRRGNAGVAAASLGERLFKPRLQLVGALDAQSLDVIPPSQDGSADQIHFVNEIITQLTENGVITILRFVNAKAGVGAPAADPQRLLA